jgi:CDP-glucose 4,6-dehydratase
MQVDPTFWLHRRVLVTGHTGFKGIWLCRCLHHLGADVVGYALPPGSSRPFWEHARVAGLVHDVRGDIRDGALLARVVAGFRPDVIFHLAARALVLDALREPAETFEVNTLGTVRLLEAAQRSPGLRSVVVVTSDKVYRDPSRICEEDDPLGGRDPYSASKAAAELVVESYRRCHLTPADGVGVATARAGNVVGAGDFSPNRLVPDIVRALVAGEPPRLRHPEHRRPWQHVLDAVRGYILLAQAAARDPARYSGAWNFGPPAGIGDRTVAELTAAVLAAWGGVGWQPGEPLSDVELECQRLSVRKARERLGWQPLLPLPLLATWTVEGYRRLLAGGDDGWIDRQIGEHFARAGRVAHAAALRPQEPVDAVA